MDQVQYYEYVEGRIVRRDTLEEADYVDAVDYAKLEAEAQALREEVADLRARLVVLPPSPYMPGVDARDLTEYEHGEAQGRCDMWEEVKRLNGKAVSEGLLRECLAFVENGFHGTDALELMDKLRVLLGEGTEHE